MNQSDLSFALLGPCMAMTERGLQVDEPLRQERITLLEGEGATLLAAAQPLVAAVKERLKSPTLFFKQKRCGCCGGGKVSAQRCWQCGGMSKQPKTRVEWGEVAVLQGKDERKYSIKELRELLPVCAVCKGKGKLESFHFNMSSHAQLKDVLYNGLKLPLRTEKKKVTTDEEALESLLSHDKSGLVVLALRYGKLDTMRSIYERIIPSADGAVRTVCNPAGTYTGRFSSASAFYVAGSTNLQNLPANTATRDPLFAVRDCIVPRTGRYFLYADLSQAEARVSAACAGDVELLERWKDPTWDCHRWTAAQLSGKPESEIGKMERDLDGKMPRHALNYGMGPKKYWREVNAHCGLTGLPGISLDQAKSRWLAYHALHPKLEEWWDTVERELYKGNNITALHCGWVCPLYPRFDVESGRLDMESLKAAIAWEPQHTVAHVLNEGLVQLFAEEVGYRVLLQVHDAVLAEVQPEQAVGVARLFKKVLERSITVHGIELVIPAEVFVMKERWSEKERIL